MKIINIIGMGKGRELAPKKGIRWGVSRVLNDMDVDVLFDIHSIKSIPDEVKESFFSRIKKAEKIGAIVYSVEKHDSPASFRYPLEDIIKEFGSDYFASSVDYALAFAIMERPDEINTYGINHAMANKLEYYEQKPSSEYWIGMARGMGIRVNIHGGMSELCKTKNRMLYGFNIRQKQYV